MKPQHQPGRDLPPNAHGNYSNLPPPPPRYPPNGYKYPAHGMRHPGLFTRGMFPSGLFHPDRFPIPPLLTMNMAHHQGGRPPSRMSGYIHPFQHPSRGFHQPGGKSPPRISDHSLHYGGHSGNRSPNRGQPPPMHNMDRKSSYEGKSRSRSPSVIQSRGRSPAVPAGGQSPTRPSSHGASPPRPNSGGKSPSHPSSSGTSPSRHSYSERISSTSTSSTSGKSPTRYESNSDETFVHELDKQPTSVIRNAIVTSAMTTMASDRPPLKLTISKHALSCSSDPGDGPAAQKTDTSSNIPLCLVTNRSTSVDEISKSTASSSSVVPADRPFPNVIKISGLGSMGTKVVRAGFSSQILPLKKRICTAFALEQDTQAIAFRPHVDLTNLEGKRLHVLTDLNTGSVGSSPPMMGIPAPLPSFVMDSPPGDILKTPIAKTDTKDSRANTRKRKSLSQKDSSPAEKKAKSELNTSKANEPKSKATVAKPVTPIRKSSRTTRSQFRRSYSPDNSTPTEDKKEPEKLKDSEQIDKTPETTKSNTQKSSKSKVASTKSVEKSQTDHNHDDVTEASKPQKATPNKSTKKAKDGATPSSAKLDKTSQQQAKDISEADKAKGNSAQDNTKDGIVQDKTESSGVQDKGKGSGAQDETKGKSAQDKTRGSDVQEKTKGKSAHDKTKGKSTQDKAKGKSAQDKTKGSDLQDKTKGKSAQDKTKGSDVEEKTKDKNAQDKTKGSDAQEKTKGKSAQDKTKGNSAQDKTTKGSDVHEKTKGKSAQDKTKGSDAQHKTKGKSAQDKTKGNSAQDKTKGSKKESTEDKLSSEVEVESKLVDKTSEATKSVKKKKLEKSCERSGSVVKTEQSSTQNAENSMQQGKQTRRRSKSPLQTNKISSKPNAQQAKDSGAYVVKNTSVRINNISCADIPSSLVDMMSSSLLMTGHQTPKLPHGQKNLPGLTDTPTTHGASHRSRSKRLEMLKNVAPTITNLLEQPGYGLSLPMHLPPFTLTMPEVLRQQAGSAPGKTPIMRLPAIPKIPRIKDKSASETEMPKKIVTPDKPKPKHAKLAGPKSARSKTMKPEENDPDAQRSPESIPMKDVSVKICRLSPKALGEKKTASASEVEKQACPINSQVSPGKCDHELGSPKSHHENMQSTSSCHTDFQNHGSGLLEDLLWQVQKGYFLRRGDEESSVSIEEAASVAQAVSCDQEGTSHTHVRPHSVVNSPESSIHDLPRSSDLQTRMNATVMNKVTSEDGKTCHKNNTNIRHKYVSAPLQQFDQSDDDDSDAPLVIDIPPDDEEPPLVVEEPKQQENNVPNETANETKPGLKTVIKVPKISPKRGKKGRRKSRKKSVKKTELSTDEASTSHKEEFSSLSNELEKDSTDNGKDSGIESAGVPDQLKESDASETSDKDKFKDSSNSSVACRKKTNMTGAVIYSTSSMLKSTAKLKTKSRGIDAICASLVNKKVASQQSVPSPTDEADIVETKVSSENDGLNQENDIGLTNAAELEPSKSETLETKLCVPATSDNAQDIPDVETSKEPVCQASSNKPGTKRKSKGRASKGRKSKVKSVISVSEMESTCTSSQPEVATEKDSAEDYSSLQSNIPPVSSMSSRPEQLQSELPIEIPSVPVEPAPPTIGRSSRAAKRKALTNISKTAEDSVDAMEQDDTSAPPEPSTEPVSEPPKEIELPISNKKKRGRPSRSKSRVSEKNMSPSVSNVFPSPVVVPSITERQMVTDPTTESAAELATENVIERAAEHVTEHLTEHAAEHVTEHAAEHITEHSTEHVTEHAAENATEHLTEHAAEHATDILSIPSTEPTPEPELEESGYKVDTIVAPTQSKGKRKRKGRGKKVKPSLQTDNTVATQAQADKSAAPNQTCEQNTEVEDQVNEVNQEHDVPKPEKTKPNFSLNDASPIDSTAKKFFTSHGSRSKLSPPYTILSGLISPSSKTGLSPSYNAHPMGSASRKLKQPVVKPTIAIYDFDEDDDEGKLITKNEGDKSRVTTKGGKGKRGKGRPKGKARQQELEVEPEEKENEEEYVQPDVYQPQSRFLRPRSKVNYNENESDQKPKQAVAKLPVPGTTISVNKSAVSLKIKIPKPSITEIDSENPSECESEPSVEAEVEPSSVPQRAPQMPTSSKPKKRHRRSSSSHKMTVTSETISVTTNEVTKFGSDNEEAPVMRAPRLDHQNAHMSSGFCQGCKDGTCSTMVTTRRVCFRLVKIGQGLWKTVSVVEDPITHETHEEPYEASEHSSSSASDQSSDEEDKSVRSRSRSSSSSSAGSNSDMPELNDSAAYDRSNNNDSDSDSTATPPVLQKTPSSASPRSRRRRSAASTKYDSDTEDSDENLDLLDKSNVQSTPPVLQKTPVSTSPRPKRRRSAAPIKDHSDTEDSDIKSDLLDKSNVQSMPPVPHRTPTSTSPRGRRSAVSRKNRPDTDDLDVTSELLEKSNAQSRRSLDNSTVHSRLDDSLFQVHNKLDDSTMRSDLDDSTLHSRSNLGDSTIHSLSNLEDSFQSRSNSDESMVHSHSALDESVTGTKSADSSLRTKRKKNNFDPNKSSETSTKTRKSDANYYSASQYDMSSGSNPRVLRGHKLEKPLETIQLDIAASLGIVSPRAYHTRKSECVADQEMDRYPQFNPKHQKSGATPAREQRYEKSKEVIQMEQLASGYGMKSPQSSSSRKVFNMHDSDVERVPLLSPRQNRGGNTPVRPIFEDISPACSPRVNQRRKSEQSRTDFEGFRSPNSSPRVHHARKSLPDVAAQCFSPRSSRRRTSDYIEDASEIELPPKRVLRSGTGSESTSTRRSSEYAHDQQHYYTNPPVLEPDLFPPVLESYDVNKPHRHHSEDGRTSHRSSPRGKYLPCVEDISDDDDDDNDSCPPKLENMMTEADQPLQHSRITRSRTNKYKEDSNATQTLKNDDFAVPTPPPKYAPENVLEEAIQFDSEMSQSSCSSPVYPIVSPLTMHENKPGTKDKFKKGMDEVDEMDFANGFLNSTRTLSAEIEEQIQKQQIQLQQLQQQQQVQQQDSCFMPPLEVTPFAPDFQDMDDAYEMGLMPMATNTNGVVYGALNPSQMNTVCNGQVPNPNVQDLNTPKGKGGKRSSENKRRSSKGKGKKATVSEEASTSAGPSRADNAMDKLLSQESALGFGLEDFDDSTFGGNNAPGGSLDDLFGSSLMDQIAGAQNTDFNFTQQDARLLSSGKDNILQCVDVIGETKMVVHRPGAMTPRRPHHVPDLQRQSSGGRDINMGASTMGMHACHCGAQFTDHWSYQEHEVFCSGPQLFGL